LNATFDLRVSDSDEIPENMKTMILNQVLRKRVIEKVEEEVII